MNTSSELLIFTISFITPQNISWNNPFVSVPTMRHERMIKQATFLHPVMTFPQSDQTNISCCVRQASLQPLHYLRRRGGTPVHVNCGLWDIDIDLGLPRPGSHVIVSRDQHDGDNISKRHSLWQSKSLKQYRRCWCFQWYLPHLLYFWFHNIRASVLNVAETRIITWHKILKWSENIPWQARSNVTPNATIEFNVLPNQKRRRHNPCPKLSPLLQPGIQYNHTWTSYVCCQHVAPGCHAITPSKDNWCSQYV